MSADFEKVRRHVKAAESATRILRKFSWWEPGAETQSPNRARFADKFNYINAKLKAWRLAKIVAEFQLPRTKLNNLIIRTIAAVDDLIRSESVSAKRAIEQLAKGGDCVAALASWWGGLDHDLKDALQYHIERTLGLTSPAPSATQILENCDRGERIFAVLNNDLWQFAGELRQLRDVLDADSSKNAFEYACVYRIASAWHENTGKIPTLSFNKDAVSGYSKTKFQKYLQEATSPRPIGDMILRQTLSVFRSDLGDATP
jgi:hypothetical protein